MLTFKDMGTTDKDLGGKRLLLQIKQLRGAGIHTGIMETEKHPDSELPLAAIGAVHEFGSSDGRVPERSWLRRAIRENDKRWQTWLENGLKRFIDSRGSIPLVSILVGFGEVMASDVRRTIDKVLSPPKAESTLRKEGADKTHPLIWLGYMRAAVRSRITMRGLAAKLTSKGTRK